MITIGDNQEQPTTRERSQEATAAQGDMQRRYHISDETHSSIQGGVDASAGISDQV